MGWLMPAMAIGGALMGRSSAKQAKKQRRQDQKMNEIEARYSHWLNPQYRQVGPGASTMGMALGGAMQGGLMGAQIGKATGWGMSDPVTTPNSPLGGDAMSKELESQFAPSISKMREQIGMAPQVPSVDQMMGPGPMRGPASMPQQGPTMGVGQPLSVYQNPITRKPYGSMGFSGM